MPQKPLLIFPRPSEADRESLPPSHGHPVRQTVDDVWNICSPKLTAIRENFVSERTNLTESALGVEPELVLVLEVLGGIDAFYNCVARIQGLEWLVENRISEDDEELDTQSDGRLYLMMSNRTALDQLYNLWKDYKDNPDYTFEQGLGKFKQLFILLKDVRRWGVKDRIHETGIEEDWRYAIARGADLLRFDIELWYRNDNAKRNAAESRIRSIVVDSHGTVIASCCVEEIKYHALKVVMPSNIISQILESDDAEFIKAEEIMYVRPCGQFVNNEIVRDETELVDPLTTTTVERENISPEPVVGVLDGLPIVEHSLLKDRVILDDPDELSEDYPPDKRIHGTAMTSLVLHGDLNAHEPPINSKIYFRPIFKYENGLEQIPSNVFVVDLLHRAIRRMFEKEGEASPVSPKVKVINLSLGDASREFFSDMSPLARLIDWLSYKYNVLMIISAGNHTDKIKLNVGLREFESKDQKTKEALFSEFINLDMRNRRLLSPAESVNAITVGSVHNDRCYDFMLGYRHNPFERLMPSPISSVGDGYNRSVKPDVVIDGGRQLYRSVSFGSTFVEYDICTMSGEPGIRVACPGAPGELNRTCFSRGTSCSAALITHNCCRGYTALYDVLVDRIGRKEFDRYIACMLKAMVVHSANWDELRSNLGDSLGMDDGGEEQRRQISKYIGYGLSSIGRVLECTNHRVTLIGYGQLKNNKAHTYTFPLPTSVNSFRGIKKFIVTLAWLTPVTTTNRKYRNANLWFKILNDSSVGSRTEVDHRKVRRGTVQHEVFVNERAIAVLQDDGVTVKVNCRQSAAAIVEPVKYALFVTYEVDGALDADIYAEIATKLQSRAEILNTVEQISIA